jgi:hypothetical protein
MKKIKNLTIYLFTFLILFSCSNDNENENTTPEVIKPKKVTVAEVGSTPYTMQFEYNQNFITKITYSTGRIITINYTSDKKVLNYKIQEGTGSVTYSANYENNLLKNILTYTFFYNTNNQVIQTIDSDNFFYPNSFYQYDTNGNVKQSNDDYSTFQFTYDNSNNPFKNVFPQIDPENSWPWFGSLINNQTVVKEKLSSASIFTTSGTIWETVTYEY